LQTQEVASENLGFYYFYSIENAFDAEMFIYQFDHLIKVAYHYL